MPAVPLTQQVADGKGVSVELGSIKLVKAIARLPGEVSGPGVEVVIKVANSSTAPVSLNSVIVDLQDSSGTPATFMSAKPSSPFSGSVAVGKTATATYVFALPTTYRDPAHLTFHYTDGAPVALFVGSIQ